MVETKWSMTIVIRRQIVANGIATNIVYANRTFKQSFSWMGRNALRAVRSQVAKWTSLLLSPFHRQQTTINRTSRANVNLERKCDAQCAPRKGKRNSISANSRSQRSLSSCWRVCCHHWKYSIPSHRKSRTSAIHHQNTMWSESRVCSVCKAAIIMPLNASIWTFIFASTIHKSNLPIFIWISMSMCVRQRSTPSPPP